MKHEDQNMQTEQNIKQSFIKLLDSKTLDEITISDIVRQGHISRGTFYVHYVDKFDLLHEIEDDLLGFLQKQMDAQMAISINTNPKPEMMNMMSSPYRFITDVFKTAFANRQLILALLQQDRFLVRIKAMLIVGFLDQVEKLTGNRRFTNQLPQDYVEEIIGDDIVSFTTFWLTKSDPEPPEKLATIFMKTRYLSPYALLGLDPDIE